MKKLFFLMMISSFIVVYAPKSYSGTAKDIIKTSAILTGIIGVASIAALANPLNYSNSVYYSGHHRNYGNSHHGNRGSGYYETVYEDVWVSGYYKSVWVEPEFEWRRHRGKNIKVQVREGYYKEVYIPGHYETIPKRYWVKNRRNRKVYKTKSSNNSFPTKDKASKFYSKFQY